MRRSILLMCVLQLCLFDPRAYAEDRQPSAATINADTATFSFSLTDLTDPLAKWSNERLLQAVAKPEAMSYELAPRVWSTASRWVRHNQWAGTVRINAPVQKDGLNIYVIRRKFLADHRFTNLEAVCPCEYLAGTNAIVCVDDALKRVATTLDVSAPKNDKPTAWTDEELAKITEEVRDRLRTFMIEWIIGHEVGHLVLGHTFSDLRRSWDIASQHVGLDAERQADLYYLSTLQHENFTQFNSSIALGQTISGEYGEALKAQYGKEELQKAKAGEFAPVDVKVSPFEHPPVLLRALNLYRTLVSRYPAMRNDSYYDRIASQIRLVAASHTDPPAFCRPSEKAPISADEDLDTLFEYADLYLYEGHENWARSVLERIQQQVENGSGSDSWKKLWRATIAQ